MNPTLNPYMNPQLKPNFAFPASWPRRICAYGIDSLIAWLCLMPIWIQAVGTYFREGAVIIEIRWLVSVILLQLFYQWMFTYFLGGTIGKLIMGLRIVSIHSGQPLGLFQSFLRVMSNGLSIFFGDGLRAFALLRLDRRHVSDWVAETWVVQDSSLGHFPKRHWLLAFFILFTSSTSTFERLYSWVQRSEQVGGQIIFDADR